MRIIDVCIPNLDNKTAMEATTPQAPAKLVSDTFQMPPTLFGHTETEYNVEDDGDESTIREEQYFEADDGSSEVRLTLIFVFIYNGISSDLTCINITLNSTFKYTNCELPYRNRIALASKNHSEM